MRKIILNLAVTLDGLIEGPQGEYDWCLTDQDYGMTEFLGRTDAILFGRKSYELLLNYDPHAYPDKTKFVFSSTLKTQADNTFFISSDIKTEVERIKNMPGKDIWLYGGAQLTTALMNAGLIDELMLSVHPILLGKGKPLFSDLPSRTSLKLLDTKTYSSGLVQLFYQVL